MQAYPKELSYPNPQAVSPVETWCASHQKAARHAILPYFPTSPQSDSKSSRPLHLIATPFLIDAAYYVGKLPELYLLAGPLANHVYRIPSREFRLSAVHT
jgi:hypothetical protein